MSTEKQTKGEHIDNVITMKNVDAEIPNFVLMIMVAGLRIKFENTISNPEILNENNFRIERNLPEEYTETDDKIYFGFRLFQKELFIIPFGKKNNGIEFSNVGDIIAIKE